MRFPHLMRRKNGVYYLRRWVPDDIRSAFVNASGKPRREIWKSLGTTNRREAERRYRVKELEIDQIFEAARRKLNGGRPVDAYEIQRLVIQWQADADQRAQRDLTVNPVASDSRADVVEANRQDEDDLLYPDPWTAAHVKQVAATLAERHGLTLEPGSDAQRTLFELLRRAMLENTRRFGRRLDSDFGWRGDPLFAQEPRQAEPEIVSGPTLSEILDRWLAERKPPTRTRIEWSTAVRRFEEINGALPITAIRRDHIRAFKDALLQCPSRLPHKLRKKTLPQIIAATKNTVTPRLTAATVNKLLHSISSLLNWSVKNGFVETNVASGMGVAQAKNTTDPRQPYSDADIRLIFADIPRWRKSHPARFWLPVLAAFTGARLGELGQLCTDDVRERDGITFLDINSEGDGKSIKTRSSQREVPIHPDLVELGFLEYVADRRTKGGGQLFPDIKPDSVGRLTGNFSKWWTRYSRDLGIDRRRVFHSWRHAFKERCRAAGISEEVHDALTGHSGGGVGRSYGSVPLATKAEAIAKIKADVSPLC